LGRDITARYHIPLLVKSQPLDDEKELDRLRRVYALALQHLISESRKTEVQVKQLSLPVSLEACRRLSAQRRAEAQARDAYVVAANDLVAFVQQHSYVVN